MDQVSERSSVDKVPYCSTMTVNDANKRYDDWTHLVRWIHDRQISVHVYDKTIAGNLKVKRLLDPCRNSLLNPSTEVLNGKYDYYNLMCRFYDNGIPVKANILMQNNAVADAVVESGNYEFLRFTDNVGGKRRLAAVKTQILFDPTTPSGKTAVVALPQNITIGLNNAQVGINSNSSFVAPRCDGYWPSYECWMREYYHYTVNGLPTPGSRQCPNEFLWGQDFWNNAETLAARGVLNNGPNGLELKQTVLTSIDSIKIYGVIYNHRSNPSAPSGFLSFVNREDYKLHKRSIT